MTIAGRARRAAATSTTTPDLVVIQVYITSARRAYALADHYRARGAYVALGGLHVTSLPDEAAAHADTIFLGPGEDTWPRFLADFARGRAAARATRRRTRTLAGLPPIRRDLIKRHLYLVPNSIVVSRGCPHVCDFCYKEAFFEGGKSFYTQTVDDALAEIERLPGRHLYFLDDHLFGNRRFADGAVRRACAAWAGCGRRPARSTSVLQPGPAGAGRRRRPAQPVRRLRDAQRRQPRRAAQVPEPRPRLRRRDPPPARRSA